VLDLQHIDVVVVDLMLLDGNGSELVALARERGMKVLLISGNAERQKVLHSYGVPFLCKPFRLAELVGKVRRLAGS
jgi:DNA-binding response OmpR family regulator